MKRQGFSLIGKQLSKIQCSMFDCFTRLLRSARGFTLKDHLNNNELYAEVPKATDTVKQNRFKLAGHCYRHPDEAASNLVLWIPNHGKRGRGRLARTFVQQLGS